MRIIRCKVERRCYYGILEGDSSISVIKGLPFQTIKETGLRFSIEEVKLLAPCTPSKVIGIGLNYRDHAEELGMPVPEEPLIFLKPETSVIGPFERIRYPSVAQRVDFEAELAVIIGKYAKAVSVEHARHVILGYTCFNDVTARDLQFKDVQYTRAKGFDTFAPLGPWIETDVDPLQVSIECYLNGERKQHSNTTHLIFDPYTVVSFVSHIMTLKPGDVIASGTPPGVGPMKPGDTVEVKIEHIGSLINHVAYDWEP